MAYKVVMQSARGGISRERVVPTKLDALVISRAWALELQRQGFVVRPRAPVGCWSATDRRPGGGMTEIVIYITKIQQEGGKER